MRAKKAGSRGGGAKTRRTAAESLETPASLSTFPARGKPLELAANKRGPTIRNDCGASLGSAIIDFDNQMATFHLFAVSLDLNMDR